MLRSSLVLVLSLAACAPPSSTPIYVGGGGAPAAAPARSRGIVVRGRVPRGKRIDHIVAVQVDASGRRQRIRVRPAADGTYAVQLPAGHRYAMAYEDRGRLVGRMSFPSAGGRQSQVINVSQNVVINQNQYVDLGEPAYVGGVFVAAYDPETFLDSDGDGLVDAQDPDDVDDDGLIVAEASFEGDFEDVDDAEHAPEAHELDADTSDDDNEGY
jgi:hypothetical protein